MFNLNISKHISRLTPPFWRKAFTTEWLEALLYPMRTVNAQFNTWVAARRLELTYNGQTIHLERLLNDIFDNTLRRIKIVHSTDTREFDYFIAEGQPADFDYFQSEGEEAGFSYYVFEFNVDVIEGFRVTLPTSLSSLEDKIKGQILRYKLATTPYELLYI